MNTTSPVPTAHIDDPASISALMRQYHRIHGPDFQFAVRRWQGDTVFPFYGRPTAWHFVIESTDAAIRLRQGDLVRGPSASNVYDTSGNGHARLTAPHEEPLWPGDAFVSDSRHGVAEVSGSGALLEIITESTDYPAPKLSLLRNLIDRPAGCAAYDGAFRRETLPPVRPADGDPNRVGVNRVNQHTLDMRSDRTPPPTRHHHGTIAGPDGQIWNHTETAIVLPRAAYGLPLIAGTEEGWALIYPDPERHGTRKAVRVPVRPGSIVMTPATPDSVFGHCFENAFAMLVAVPGFVAPYVLIS